MIQLAIGNLYFVHFIEVFGMGVIWNEEYTGSQHQAAIYNKIQKHVHVIATKFNITINENGISSSKN